ncbi:prepilin-type N-terminal cleavage/methylation domain-containing protein [bacterium]|jgi:prepilin-type N-terminal cleavage/methylation domain-containing protein|nr:prepilin-type N-terminal cleavage/methylation domain-containing protein [bacterium]
MKSRGISKKVNQVFKSGFTLIEVLVALTASTVILGGFLIAFSNLNQISNTADLDLAKIQQGNNVRMGISKALTGASHAIFRSVDNSSLGDSVDMLYYFKYNDEDALVELGYFYIDEQRETIDPFYEERRDGDGNLIAQTHLFYKREEFSPPNTDEFPPDPKDFNLLASDRTVAVQDATDFVVNLVQVEQTETDQLLKFNLDYQVTTEHFSALSNADGTADRRTRLFKGTTYALGKVTG